MRDLLILVPGFLFGAFIGSFLNVCIHRLPRNESVVLPPSRCYACGTRVAWYDNLPILSWLILRGRCRFCGSGFSIRYLVGESTVGLLTAAILWWAMSGQPVWPGWLAAIDGVDLPYARAAGAVALLTMLFFLWVAALIDYDHTIIPDEVTMPLQLVAPLLGILTPLPLLLGFWPESWWLSTNSLLGAPRYDPLVGLGACLWILLPAIATLPLSLPLARWIYSTCPGSDQQWSDKDHRGFRLGVWWFTAVSVVHLLLLVGLSFVAIPGRPPGPWLWLQIQFALALLGSLAGWWSLYGIGLIGTLVFRRNAMGFGDVKLLAPVGAVLGPFGVVLTFLAAALVGTLIGLPRRLLGRGREIPFGPFLAMGALIAAATGPWVAAYLRQLWRL